MKKPVLKLQRPPAAAPPLDPAVAEAFLRGGSTEPATKTSTAPRAPQGSKVLIERKRRPPRRRSTIYFDPTQYAALEAWCRENRREVSDAVREGVALLLAGVR